MTAASPRFRGVRTDRPPGLRLVGIGAEGEQQTERDQPVQSEHEQRSNEHDDGKDGQNQPASTPGGSGRRGPQSLVVGAERVGNDGVRHGDVQLSDLMTSACGPGPRATRTRC